MPDEAQDGDAEAELVRRLVDSHDALLDEQARLLRECGRLREVLQAELQHIQAALAHLEAAGTLPSSNDRKDP